MTDKANDVPGWGNAPTIMENRTIIIVLTCNRLVGAPNAVIGSLSIFYPIIKLDK
jgi:hypothetical protein